MIFRKLLITVIFAVLALVISCSHQPASSQQPSSIGHKAADIAKSMVGAPYRYGGTTPKQGFDCSGLVQYSYRKAGASVARSTLRQRRTSRIISPHQLEKGDLLFFNQLGKRSSHVGIYVGNNKFAHAPSSGKRVRINRLSDPYWKKHLASARRFSQL